MLPHISNKYKITLPLLHLPLQANSYKGYRAMLLYKITHTIL